MIPFSLSMYMFIDIAGYGGEYRGNGLLEKGVRYKEIEKGKNTEKY